MLFLLFPPLVAQILHLVLLLVAHQLLVPAHANVNLSIARSRCQSVSRSFLLVRPAAHRAARSPAQFSAFQPPFYSPNFPDSRHSMKTPLLLRAFRCRTPIEHCPCASASFLRVLHPAETTGPLEKTSKRGVSPGACIHIPFSAQCLNDFYSASVMQLYACGCPQRHHQGAASISIQTPADIIISPPTLAPAPQQSYL